MNSLKFVLLLVCASLLSAQTAPREDRTYFYSRTVTMTGSDYGVSLVVPASASMSAKPLYWIIRCSVPCSAELYRDGTLTGGSIDTVPRYDGQDLSSVTPYYGTQISGGKLR